MPHPSPSSHTLHVFRQDWTAETSNQIFPLYDAILQYTVETLLLAPNVLRDSILVRMELMQFECYVHVNAIVWRLIYRELRAVTNENTLDLNPLELNDLYDYLWDVGELLQGDESLDIMQEGWRPWPRVKEGSEASWDFYDILDRHKARDLELLNRYQVRADVEQYTAMLKTVLRLFGEAITSRHRAKKRYWHIMWRA